MSAKIEGVERYPSGRIKHDPTQKARAKKWAQENSTRDKANHFNARLKREYNITAADYGVMLGKQEGLCAICSKVLTRGRNGYAIDHCHKTDKVRALLCGQCNKGLGYFKDNEYTLCSAIEYLKLHRQEAVNV